MRVLRLMPWWARGPDSGGCRAASAGDDSVIRFNGCANYSPGAPPIWRKIRYRFAPLAGYQGSRARSMGQKLHYLRDRFVNALAMLRSGQGKLFLTSAQVEYAKRQHEVLNFIARKTGVKLINRPDSAFVNQRKVVPPSYRPTRLQQSAADNVSPELGAEIRDILAAMPLPERNAE